jgi:hypothetical protein
MIKSMALDMLTTGDYLVKGYQASWAPLPSMMMFNTVPTPHA